MHGRTRRAIAALMAIAAAGSARASSEIKKPPYWASIAAGQALLRTGPGRNYPALWLYRRPDLPIRVIAIYQSWRKIEDPDGAQGWMLVNLLSDQRTAIVRGAPRPLRDSAEAGSRVMLVAAPGVIGRISRCDAGWCEFDAHGRGGYTETSGLWGVDASEHVK